MARLLILVLVLLAALAIPAQASFPGRNGSIVWVEQSSGGGVADAELIALNPRTGAERRIWNCYSGDPDPAKRCGGVSGPAVSPDGRMALVWTRISHEPGSVPQQGVLARFARTGAPEAQIDLPPEISLRNDGGRRRLRFLNDGLTLAAELYTGEAANPYLQRLLGLDGTFGAQAAPAGAESLDWSIGGRLAFTKDSNLFVVDRDGSQRQLTTRGGQDPSWSPRGRWIAFTRKHDLYLVDSRGGRARRLTRRGGDSPAWSPDGRKIAFLRWKPHRTDKLAYEGIPYLYVLDVRSGTARQVLDRELPHDREFASPPEWQPLPR
jgi:dipeptidyl aminopeptidase/acylaminoacyl peptidase